MYTCLTKVKLLEYGSSSVYRLLFDLKEFLKLIGWTVLKSSDGTTYFSSSDGITHDKSGAGGASNVSSWFLIQQPSGGSAPFSGSRQFSIMCDGTCFYSRSGGFTGGSAGARPTAADERNLTSPGSFPAPPILAKQNLYFVGDATGEYGFSWALIYFGSSTFANQQLQTGIICMDAMQVGSFPYSSGSLSTSDQDPVVFKFTDNDFGLVHHALNRYNLSGTTWSSDFASLGLTYAAATTEFPGLIQNFQAPTNPASDMIPTIPVAYYSINYGWKGVSSLFIGASALLGNINTASNDDGEDFISVGSNGRSSFLLPWDRTVRVRR